MAYLHIQNLYRKQTILLFRECYALEKVHGTSAHISWSDSRLTFFSGGENHQKFVALFDQEKLRSEFEHKFSGFKIVIFGEAYGGKCQAMKDTYGPDLRFIVFDIQIDENWLAVPKMDKVATDFGFEVVPWTKILTEPAILDAERDRLSEVAIRRGCGDREREGIVLRPLEEMTTNDGERVISKHKGEKFSERITSQKILSPDKLVVLELADAIAEEWCVMNRLEHVLEHLKADGIMPQMENIPKIINAMVNDIYREAKGEIVEAKEVRTAIGKRTVQLFKKYLNEK